MSPRGDKASSQLATVPIRVGTSASKRRRAIDVWGRLLGKGRHVGTGAQACKSVTAGVRGHRRDFPRLREIPKKKPQPYIHCEERMFVSSLSFIPVQTRSLACVLLWWSLSLNKENQSLEDY